MDVIGLVKQAADDKSVTLTLLIRPRIDGMESRFTDARWRSLANRLGISNADSAYLALHHQYSESWRSYHNVSHIDDCLHKFDESPESCEHPDELEFAIWFHDAVYDTRRSDNESRSADMAQTILRACKLQPASIDRVRAGILATAHDTVPIRTDERLIVDIDLSILGCQADEYDRFESAIRKEYSWVPWPVYSEKRCDILKSFLARSRIYNSPWFFNNHESLARSNLARAIDQLTDTTQVNH